MSDITLSKGVRQNLLSLQNTAELLGRTQDRLSTGKKVNSALDSPVNFFTAAGLSARSGDLSRLLDSIGNAVQTVQAADKGISAITKLIESARATANQALTAAAPAATYNQTIAGTAAVVADDAAEAVGNVDISTAVNLGGYADETVTITVNGQQTVITLQAGDDSDDLVGYINAIAGISAVVNGDDFIEITADDNETVFSIAYSDADIGADIGLAAGTFGPTNDDIANNFNGDTLTVQVGSGTATSITFDSRHDLLTQLNAIDGITASFNGDDELEIVSTLEGAITLGGDALGDLGLAAGPHEPTATIGAPNATRASLQADFNQLLTQITQLAQDSSFNGINLINGDNLTVTFNEDGSSSLTINGVDFTAAGLGLTAQTGDDFQSNAGVNAAIAQLDTATSTLRAQASAFGSNLSIIQTRQDFTKNMINVLQIGADNLTLADTNEEGANMLALNTRQQLSTVALSMAAQADQNVLRLF